MNPAAIVFVVVTTAPPLPPAEAARVLQSSRSIADRSHVYVLREDEMPHSLTIQSTPGSGPFGPFPKQEFRPLGVHTIHGITFRIPRRGR
jgi:hypothetical protein